MPFLSALEVFTLSPVHTSDNVAKNGDIVAETGDIVAKNTMLPVSVTMSPFLATLSLVWTGLNALYRSSLYFTYLLTSQRRKATDLDSSPVVKPKPATVIFPLVLDLVLLRELLALRVTQTHTE